MFRTLLAVLIVLGAPAAPAMIYGTDDRREALTSWAKAQAPAVLLMTGKNFIVDEGDPRFVKLDFARAAGENSLINLCSGQRFAEQLTAGINCSGFLIAPDLVVTAGHCIVPYGRSESRATPGCTDFVWIADFALPADGSALKVDRWPREKIFECAEVIDGQNPDFSSPRFAPPVFGDDYALVRLKTPAAGRTPLELSRELRPPRQLHVMGYPLGLPLKVAGPARVLDEGFAKFYSANLDTFMGNSGSPVFDEKGLVHGILVRGYPEDFVSDGAECYTQNKCSESGDRCDEASDFFATGSHVQRLGVVHAAVAKYRGLEPALVAGWRPLFTPPARAGLFTPARPSASLTGARNQTFIDPNARAPGGVSPRRSFPAPSGAEGR